MNSESVNTDNRFKELVECYLDGSISEEQSEELLYMVKGDEALREEFAGQLQVSQLLRNRENNGEGSVAEGVLAVLGTGRPLFRKVWSNFSWQTFLVSTAAVLAVALGISYVAQVYGPRKPVEKERVMTVEIRRPEILPELTEPEKPEDVMPDVSHDMEELRDRPMPDPVQPKTEPDSRPAPHRSPVPEATVKEEEKTVPLKIEYPKPHFSGTPKDIRSANLESSAERAARQGYSHLSVIPAPSCPMPEPSRESYAKIEANTFLNPKDNPLSTFSIDVDTASYANLRRMLSGGQLPPADAVRLEEMINYFEYDYEGPGDDKPFATAMSMHLCPWNQDHHLLRIGIQGRKLDERGRKPSNLVFLLDVSGSMDSHDKLPLLKKGMGMLVRALTENDRVAIVVYAGSTGLVLDSTSAAEKGRIIEAMERLSAGGSTAGGAGIELAYRVAQDNFIKGGINRVILATDGDFNVGVSSHEGLEKLIEEKRGSGVFLSVLGFGTGNLQDSKMELLANKGNGNYFYIDSEREAQKVLVRQLNATLVTIARDVKIQVKFNPEQVKSYRLIGYENRKMAARDFEDDKKDAGEIGAGHQVTALYEIVPVGAPDAYQGVPLKYGDRDKKAREPRSGEMLTLKLRYKAPEGEESQLVQFVFRSDDFRGGRGDASFRWAAAVAAFGQVLRGSEYIGRFSLHEVRVLAAEAKGEDSDGCRAEMLSLIDRAIALKGEEPPKTDKGYPIWQYRNPKPDLPVLRDPISSRS